MSLTERLASVDAQIAEAARLAGRDPKELTRIVVTKFWPASLVRELAALGVKDVGENRHQEAETKAQETADLKLNWHFVGQLQSNKARFVRSYATLIHSLDRPSLLHALRSEENECDVLIEIDLSGEPGRGGVAPENMAALASRVLETNGVRLRGVMAVAPLGEEPRRAFARLREISETVCTLSPEANLISAGMSGDFVEAIMEGATHLRIGAAITGKRPYPG